MQTRTSFITKMGSSANLNTNCYINVSSDLSLDTKLSRKYMQLAENNRIYRPVCS